MFQELNVVQKGSWELKCCVEFQRPSKSSTESVQAPCTPGLCAGKYWKKDTQFHSNLNYSQSMKSSGKSYFILHIYVMTGRSLARVD